MEQGLNVPKITLKCLELHASTDTQNLLDLDVAAQSTETLRFRMHKTKQTIRHDGFEGGTLPVPQQGAHIPKLCAAGGNGLNAAPQSAVLPQAGGRGASQSHLTHVQNVSD